MIQPRNVCLVQMGKKGLELVEAYPEISDVRNLNEIIIKSMPLGAKNGDFSTTTISDAIAFSSFIFSVPRTDERDNIASIVAVFDTPNYDSLQVQYTFSEIISALKKNDLQLIETLQNLLPNILKGLSVGFLQIKVSSVVTVDIKYRAKKEKDDPSKIVKDFKDDIWT